MTVSSHWALIRVVTLGIALAIVFALLWRQGLDSRLRFVLIGAVALFAVRVYLAVAQYRRRER